MSPYASDFNRDCGLSFTRDELARGNCYKFGARGFSNEEAPGLSVF